MNRLPLGEESLTLKTILTEHRRVEELKRLAAICRKNKEPLPTRKTDLAKLIMDHLEGDGLHLVWEELDELQRAAVAEVVHSDSTEFDPGRFRAKYGADPSFGTADNRGTRLEPSRLGLLLYDIYGHGTRLPADLKLRLAKLVPAPRETAIETLHELPPAWARTVEHWNPRTKQPLRRPHVRDDQCARRVLPRHRRRGFSALTGVSLIDEDGNDFPRSAVISSRMTGNFCTVETMIFFPPSMNLRRSPECSACPTVAPTCMNCLMVLWI